jgi:hypothetical protein
MKFILIAISLIGSSAFAWVQPNTKIIGVVQSFNEKEVIVKIQNGKRVAIPRSVVVNQTLKTNVLSALEIPASQLNLISPVDTPRRPSSKK